jgi:hypothetical protein
MTIAPAVSASAIPSLNTRMSPLEPTTRTNSDEPASLALQITPCLRISEVLRCSGKMTSSAPKPSRSRFGEWALFRRGWVIVDKLQVVAHVVLVK